jgi:hypothetical protein
MDVMVSREAGPMHYVVEVRTAAGGWLRKRGEHKLLADAWREAERVKTAGGESRIVQVGDDGTRKVIG